MAGSQLYRSTGGASFWPGAIIGDLPNPDGAAQLAAGQFFTTGDQDAGGDGEVSGQSVFTAELWYQTPNPGGNSEVFFFGPMTTTGTGTREWGFASNVDGTVFFQARNSTPVTVFVTSLTVLLADTWYHLVGRIDGSFMKLFINGVEEASTAWSGTIQARGTTPGSMDTVIGSSTTTVTRNFDEVAFYRSSLGTSRILAHYQAGAQRGFANNQLPGARCIAALDAADSFAPRRLKVGSHSMVAEFYAGQTALDALQNARQAENVDATLFASKSGEIVFLDAAHRSSSPYNTVQMTLGDAGGTEIPYEDLGVDYSDATLANEWSVTRTNGVTQTVSDATSTASYGRRPQSITGLPLNPFGSPSGDTNALAIANAMLAKYKDPILRGTSITMNAGDPNVAEVVFDRDLADRVNVKRTPPGGGARISQDLFIQQIQISGANDGNPWSVQWGLSPI